MADYPVPSRQSLLESLMIPARFKFEDIQVGDNANLSQLVPILWLTPAILVLRLILEGIIFPRISYAMGVKEKAKRSRPTNPALESAYHSLRTDLAKAAIKGERGAKARHRVHEVVQALSRKTDMTTRQVLSWLRHRRSQDLVPVSRKFSESMFKAFFYMFTFSWGLLTLWGKPYFTDSKECYRGYPDHPVDHMAQWYYIIELSYYFGALITMPIDNKRKDFHEMLVHHLATNFLMLFSYLANLWRVGVVVLIVHDISDIFLESAKVFNYAKWQAPSENLFICFAVVFFISRIIIFPFFVVHGTLFDAIYFTEGRTWRQAYAEDRIPIFLVVYNGLLITLLFLHMFWFSIIARMAVQFIAKGTVQGDDRSDFEESSSEVSSEDSVEDTQDDKDVVSNALYRTLSGSQINLHMNKRLSRTSMDGPENPPSLPKISEDGSTAGHADGVFDGLDEVEHVSSVSRRGPKSDAGKVEGEQAAAGTETKKDN